MSCTQYTKEIYFSPVIKKTIILGIAAGILLFAYSIGSGFFLLSLNYWEIAISLTLILFAIAGGAYVRFTARTPSNTNREDTQEKNKLSIEALDLSPRETDVLQEICLGKSNKQIANSLHISESTVKTHVSKLLVKFDVQSRTQIMHKMQASETTTLVGNTENHTKV